LNRREIEQFRDKTTGRINMAPSNSAPSSTSTNKNDSTNTNDNMKPSEMAKANGLASLREVSRMVNRSEAILYTWGRERPDLLEAIIIGCAVIKRHREKEKGAA
jgi:hypothetical protein